MDFFQKYFRKDESPEHYLVVSRVFTVFWAIVIIIPAIMYSALEGSVLQTLSKIGSYFVGAKLSMYGLGFFSKQTTEKGLLVGVVFGFVMVWYLATQTDIAWRWYCLFGGGVNIIISLIASRAIDGAQTEWSEFSIEGQKRKFREEGLPEKQDGWYLIPGKVDRVSYLLLVFFVLTILFLFLFERLI